MQVWSLSDPSRCMLREKRSACGGCGHERAASSMAPRDSLTSRVSWRISGADRARQSALASMAAGLFAVRARGGGPRGAPPGDACPTIRKDPHVRRRGRAAVAGRRAGPLGARDLVRGTANAEANIDILLDGPPGLLPLGASTQRDGAMCR